MICPYCEETRALRPGMGLNMPRTKENIDYCYCPKCDKAWNDPVSMAMIYQLMASEEARIKAEKKLE